MFVLIFDWAIKIEKFYKQIRNYVLEIQPFPENV